MYWYQVQKSYLGIEFIPYKPEVHGDMDGIMCLRDCIGRPLLYTKTGNCHFVAARVDEYGEVLQTS